MKKTISTVFVLCLICVIISACGEGESQPKNIDNKSNEPIESTRSFDLNSTENKEKEIVGFWQGRAITSSSVNNVFIVINEDGTGTYYNDSDQDLASANAATKMTWTYNDSVLVVNYNNKKVKFLLDDTGEDIFMISSDGTKVYKTENNSNNKIDSSETEKVNEENVKPNTEELIGDWYEVNTFYILSLTDDGRGTYKKGYDAELNWETNTNGILLVGGDWTRSQLNLVEEDGCKKLTDANHTFVRFKDIPATVLDEDNTGSDSSISIKYDGYEFCDELPKDMRDKISSWSSEYAKGAELEDGQKYIAISFTLENLSKDKLIIGDSDHNLDIFVDYDDGFLFNTLADSYDTPYTYFSDGNEYCASSKACIGEINILPLTKKTITVYIRCASTMAETNAPITALFISHMDSTIKYYSVVLRK